MKAASRRERDDQAAPSRIWAPFIQNRSGWSRKLFVGLLVYLVAGSSATAENQSGQPHDSQAEIEVLLKNVKEAPVDDMWVRGLSMIALATPDAKPYAKEIAAFLKVEDPIRGYTALTLAALEAKQYAQDIAPLLKDPAFRQFAIVALAQLGATAYTNDIALLLKDADPGVRASATWALGKLEAREYATSLRDLLQDQTEAAFDTDPIGTIRNQEKLEPTTVSVVARQVLESWGIDPQELKE